MTCAGPGDSSGVGAVAARLWGAPQFDSCAFRAASGHVGKDCRGALIATLDDYAAVRERIADLVAEGAESSVPANIRETVEVVGELR